MTTDLEKKFFETFGIEPITQAVWNSTETKWKNFESWEEYPQITDTHYLQLLCLLAKELKCFTVYDEDVNALKEEILKDLILDNGYFSKQQVQELFKEN